MSWISPVVSSSLVIEAPEKLAGAKVVGVLATPCLEPAPDGYGFCGLVRNHLSDHWNCSMELIESGGPWAVVK